MVASKNAPSVCPEGVIGFLNEHLVRSSLERHLAREEQILLQDRWQQQPRNQPINDLEGRARAELAMTPFHIHANMVRSL